MKNRQELVENIRNNTVLQYLKQSIISSLSAICVVAILFYMWNGGVYDILVNTSSMSFELVTWIGGLTEQQCITAILWFIPVVLVLLCVCWYMMLKCCAAIHNRKK